jgi:DNA repair protein SbcC/Rad50
MKILAIRGENIASLAAPFELDFVAGPLAEAGIFAISGPTGSGKSSLLDAMCLPLFNKTPRLNNQGGASIGYEDSEEGSRIRANSVGGLLTRGAGSGYAEVDFQGVDNNRYRARWSVARARGRANGNIQGEKLEFSNLDSGQLLGGTKKETLDDIQEKLGFDFDQFRRAALLAQGDFAQFLKAKSSERGELLEQMTGTEIYAQISRATYQRAKEEVQALALLAQKLENLDVLDKAERKELETAVTALAKKEKVNAASIESIEKAVAWYAQEKELQSIQHQAEGELSDRLSAWADREEESWSPSTLDDSKKVESFVASNRGKLKKATELDVELVNQKKKVKALESEKKDLEGQITVEEKALATAKDCFTATSADLSEISKWQSEHADLGPLAKDWALYESELRELHRASLQLQELQGKEEKLEQDLPKAEAAMKVRAAALVLSEEALRVWKASAAEAQKKVDTISVEDAQEEQHRSHDCKAVLMGYSALIEKHASAKVEMANQEEAAGVAKLAAATAGEQLVVVKAKWEQAKSDFQRARTTLDLKDHRAELVDGEACPLCGAEEHPYAAPDSAVAQILDGQEEVVQELETQHSNLVAEESAQKKARQGAVKAKEAAAERVAAQVAGAPVFVAQWMKAAGEECKPLPALEAVDALATLEVLEAEVKAQLAVADKRIEDFGKLTEALSVANGLASGGQIKVDADKESVSGVKGDLRDLAEEAKEIKSSKESAESTRSAKMRSMEDVYEGEAWLKELLADAEKFLLEQGGFVSQWRGSCAEQLDCEKRLPKEEQHCDQVGKGLKGLNAKCLIKETELSGEQETQLAVDAQRKELFAGGATADVSEDLDLISTWNTRLGERSHNLAEHQAKGAPEREQKDLKEMLDAAREGEKELRKDLGDRRAQQSVDDSNHEKRKGLGPKMDAQGIISTRWNDLSSLIGQSSGSKFRDYAQGLTLRIVLAFANEQLRQLRPRYQLMAVPDSNLDMQIIDHDMGDEVRAVSSLSGGESFLVSLALALGLAESTGKSTAVESLFIDEGFGTLDSDTLEVAISTLDSLQASGRMVGVISHVESLSDRLGVQVLVTKIGGGRSTVQVRSATTSS